MTELSALDVKTMFYNSLLVIRNHVEFLNDINTFPVADRDTGTNVYLTLKQVWERIKDFEAKTVGELLEKISESAIENAQGNSGNILAMFFYGMHEELKNKDKITIKDLKRALKAGYEFARSAVQNPKEGTILSAIRALKEAFEWEKDLKKAFKLGIKKAINYLEMYREEVIKDKKHLLDSGGLAFVLIVSGWLKSLGESVELHLQRYYEKVEISLSGKNCINILARNVNDFQKLKRKLNDVGESVVIKKVGDKVKIHIHSDDLEKVKSIIEEHGKIEKIFVSET